MKTIETNTARLIVNNPKTATVWRMLFGLAVSVMLSSPVAAAPPSANSSVRMITATDLMPTGVDGNARGKINVNMTRQGSAINQEVKISVVNLDPNTVYGMIGYLGDDTNATGVAEFITDRKGAFNVTYVRKSQGKPSPRTQPLPAAIDLMCNVRELSIINRDLGIVLRGILTNPNRGSYQANLSMNNTGFLPRATGTVAIQAGPRSTAFLLRASGLAPRTFYSFTINGGVIDAKMSDKAGRLVLQQLPIWVSETSLALAELVFKNGFSAVVVSSPFNPEFMEHASTAALPAYLPVDGHDLHVAITEIDRRLHQLYPQRLANKALMGYSMGALETLFIASTATTNSLLHFDRYVAINTPVQMTQGIAKLDEFYSAPLNWPVAERSNNLENVFLKVAALSRSTLTPQTSLPFSAIESKFLIGLTFRLVLRDIIYSSQERNNQGVLHHAIHTFRRDPAYQEILQFSYQNYFDQFAIPYYSTINIGASTVTAMEKAGDLRTYETGLRANPDIRILTNQNDFLLTDADLLWLHATFATNRLTVFTQGGHLGNLFNLAVQKSILTALTPMQPPALPSRINSQTNGSPEF